MKDDDYEIFDSTCPKCGHDKVHVRNCTNFCEDGYMDEYDDDSINFSPGEVMLPCNECKGTGIEKWCPKCGENLSAQKIEYDEDDED